MPRKCGTPFGYGPGVKIPLRYTIGNSKKKKDRASTIYRISFAR